MSSFLLGPIYDPPTGLLTSTVSNTWASHLSEILNNVLQSGHSDFGEFEGNTSSTSITILSTEDNASFPFFDFHYTSPFLNHSAGGTNHITKNSIYRIGSISKLFTVYTLLVAYGWESWDHAVTRYVPELLNTSSLGIRHPIEAVNWNSVTIGDLASQLSGAGRDYANGDLSVQNFPWTELGLPELSPSDIPRCGGDYVEGPLPACNRQEFFGGLSQRHPVFAPQTTPIYSNLAFRILGYALEAMSRTSYNALVQSKVLGPLGLSDTSAALPPRRGSWVVPIGNQSGFHFNYGDDIPTAGIYSSSDNLARLGRSILLNKQLPGHDTRKWMKPKSHTASQFFSVGSPWEIWRTRSQITSGRVVDLYTKSGSVGQYRSQLMLLPDYGVALSILTAGPSSGTVSNIVTEMVLQSLIPTLENITIAEACESLCGTYGSLRPELNSSITIAAQGTGLYLDRWTNRGVDIKAVAQAYATQTGSLPIKKFWLQATDLRELSNTSHPGQRSRREAYRIIFDTTSEDPDGPPRVLDPNAGQWGITDNPMYGEVAFDDFVVQFNASGKAVTIQPRVERDTLERTVTTDNES